MSKPSQPGESLVLERRSRDSCRREAVSELRGAFSRGPELGCRELPRELREVRPVRPLIRLRLAENVHRAAADTLRGEPGQLTDRDVELVRADVEGLVVDLRARCAQHRDE